MQNAGFQLRSWATNDPILRERIERDGIGDSQQTVNVLGLKWDTKTDSLTFPSQPPDTQTTAAITKRTILRLTSSLFDPMGLLSPIHIKAKILLQQLWLNEAGWDDHVAQTI